MDDNIKMSYERKEEIANQFFSQYGLSWTSTPDINSLHDAESASEVIELCEERLEALYD